MSHISPSERIAISTYTSAHGYDINRMLRTGRITNPNYISVIQHLDSLFERVPPTTKPITLWRDMDIELHDHIQKGFVSTSLNNDQLDSDSDLDSPVCCQYEIHVPVDAKLLPLLELSEATNEREILLPRNSKFRYVGKEIKRGAIWIYLELELVGDQSDKETSDDEKIAKLAAIYIDRLNRGEIQSDLEEENLLLDTETTLEEYVRSLVSQHYPKEAKAIMDLINMANYAI